MQQELPHTAFIISGGEQEEKGTPARDHSRGGFRVGLHRPSYSTQAATTAHRASFAMERSGLRQLAGVERHRHAPGGRRRQARRATAPAPSTGGRPDAPAASSKDPAYQPDGAEGSGAMSASEYVGPFSLQYPSLALTSRTVTQRDRTAERSTPCPAVVLVFFRFVLFCLCAFHLRLVGRSVLALRLLSRHAVIRPVLPPTFGFCAGLL